MKTTSRFALVAAAGLLAGFAIAPAFAADMGGKDLEDRVAELEATTARKGNTKVSLTIYGQVNKAIMAWDDGHNKDASIVDNSVSSTRFGMIGKAKIGAGFTSGYNIEIELQDYPSQTIDQNSIGTAGISSSNATSSKDGSLRLRQANWYVEGERYGRVTVGLQSVATKDGINLNLSNSITTADNYWSAGFQVRTSTGGTSGLKWSNLATGLDTMRGHVVRYDTPSIYGFILSASFGENDFWDAAIRFAKEWNGIKIAAYGGYAWGTDSNIDNITVNHPKKRDQVTAGASVMHVPTGLFVNVTGGTQSADARKVNGNIVDAHYLYGQAGLERKLFPIGATTIYGEYGSYKDFAAAASVGGQTISGSDVNRWGAGITQKVDSAALDLYLQYHHYDAKLDTAAGPATTKLEDWNAVVTGARIKF